MQRQFSLSYKGDALFSKLFLKTLLIDCLQKPAPHLTVNLEYCSPNLIALFFIF